MAMNKNVWRIIWKVVLAVARALAKVFGLKDKG